MATTQKPRYRAVQARTKVTRSRIIDGAIGVIAACGVAGLTHRAIASASSVSLAATTYHFATKDEIIHEVSRNLFEGYLEASQRLSERLGSKQLDGIDSLEKLVPRFVSGAMGPEQTRSLAWCEIMLHGGRSAEGRALAQRWYAELDRIWIAIGGHFTTASRGPRPSAILDRIVGYTVLLHPLQMNTETQKGVLAGRIDLEHAIAKVAADGDAIDFGASENHARLINAAIGILADRGASHVTYGEVAQRLGMTRSGPAYYFETIGKLLSAAQRTLLARAKDRYRSALPPAPHHGPMTLDELVDLTTAIFAREALEFIEENLAYYSVWIDGAHNTETRPAIAASILGLHKAWKRRLLPIPEVSEEGAASLALQAVFTGKLVRFISAGTTTDGLSATRQDFLSALQGRYQ